MLMWAQKTVEICGSKNPLGVFRIIFLGQSHIQIDGLYFCTGAHFLSSFLVFFCVCVCVPEWSSFQDHV